MPIYKAFITSMILSTALISCSTNINKPKKLGVIRALPKTNLITSPVTLAQLNLTQRYNQSTLDTPTRLNSGLSESQYNLPSIKSSHELISREIRFLIMDLVSNDLSNQVLQANIIYQTSLKTINQQTHTSNMFDNFILHQAKQFGLNLYTDNRLDSLSSDNQLFLSTSSLNMDQGILLTAQISQANSQILSTAQRLIQVSMFEQIQDTGFKDGIDLSKYPKVSN